MYVYIHFVCCFWMILYYLNIFDVNHCVIKNSTAEMQSKLWHPSWFTGCGSVTNESFYTVRTTVSNICGYFTVLATCLSLNELKLRSHLLPLISWWDYNVSITFVVACGLPRRTLGYGLFSHYCIPQARGMCSVCPKNGTHCSSVSVETPVLEMV